MKNIRKLWQYSYNYKYCFVLLLVFTFLGAYLEIRIPQYMSQVLDCIVGAEPFSSVVRTCIIIGVLSVILVIQGIFEGYFVARWSSGVTRNLSDSLFKKIMLYESSDMDHFGSATALTRLTTDITTLRRSLEMVSSLLLCPLLVIFSVISAIRINKSLSMIFVLIIPVLGGLLIFIIVKSRGYYRKMLVNYDEMNQTLSENIGGLRTVKSYAREDKQKGIFAAITGALRDNNLSAERLAALNTPFSKMAVNFSVLALAFLGGHQIIGGTLTVGELFCLISYTNQILAQMLIISMILVPLITSQVCLDRILEMLEWDTDEPVKTVADKEVSESAADDRPAVSIRDLKFSYGDNGQGEALLQDIDFDIANGEFLGITGTGGAGKTTLIKLIMGIYKADSGSVLINGRNIGGYEKHELKNLFGYVPQKATLFSGTIKENLWTTDQPVDREKLDKACKNACIDEYIYGQPDGYETFLKEGGSNLSGGQRQRMSLARALIRDARILVMDNMTSALDRITEEKVVANLKRDYSHMTRIVISDRLSTIRGADRILVLDRGRIAGLGSHDQLLDSCPLYAEMVETQKRQIADG